MEILRALSTLTLGEINQLRQNVEQGNVHPKSAKESLALEITTRFYNADIAERAKAEFQKVFAERQMPSDMPTMEFSENEWICKILHSSGLCASSSQARRDIQAGALKINQQKVQDENLKLAVGEYIIQIGKRRFLKAIIK